MKVAGETGLEPAASGVTSRRYNQLNYSPAEEEFIYLRGVTYLVNSSLETGVGEDRGVAYR